MGRHNGVFYEFSDESGYGSKIVCPYCSKDVTSELSREIEVDTYGAESDDLVREVIDLHCPKCGKLFGIAYSACIEVHINVDMDGYKTSKIKEITPSECPRHKFKEADDKTLVIPDIYKCIICGGTITKASMDSGRIPGDIIS